MKWLSVLLLMALPGMVSGVLFLNSIPLRAEVELDGKPIGRTPLLVTNIGAGSHKVVFKKQGFYPSEISVVNPQGVTNYYSFLAPESFSLNFPENMNVVFNDKSFKSDYIRSLSSGIYEFKPTPEALVIRPVNPNKPLVYIGGGTALFGLTTGLLSKFAADGYYSAFTNARTADEAIYNMNMTSFFDSLSIVGYSLTLAGTALGVTFFIDDMNFQARVTNIEIKDKAPDMRDRDLYEKAMDSLSQLDNTNALGLLERLISQYPESQYFPVSLMRRARIFAVQGRYKDAQRDLETLRRDYPIYELYEMNLKELGDMCQTNGSFADAVRYYREMVPYVNLYPAWQPELMAAQALAAWYNKSGESRLKTEFEAARDSFLNRVGVPAESIETIKAIELKR